MHMIINNSSMVPIYEQIMEQIKAMIISGELAEDTMLPSVRGLAKDLKISTLTVKKAYDNLEQEGYTKTVHGKGTFVAKANSQLVKEECLRNLESNLEDAISSAKREGITDEEIREIFNLIMLEE